MTINISEKSINRLNAMLQSQQATTKEITDLVILLKDLTEWKLMVVDFNLYNEMYIEQLRKDKAMAIKNSEYIKAAAIRDQEIVSERYLKFIKQHQSEHSIFRFEAKAIWYCYFGNNERENEIFKALQQITEIE